ncbi:MAG: GNAT family N-acetyltransferase [Pararhizobium sp.]|nr:GNAT family N-acetyltransferase [Pararhizobium sp.]
MDPQPHVLDRPIWTALTTRHSGLALGGPLAKRYPGDVSLFTAAKDDSDECLTAVAALAAPDETMLMVQAGPIRLPPGFTEVSSADLVQMVASQPFIQVQDGEILPLGAGDAEEMLALATLTKPGPFSLKAQSFGDFWGLKSNGRLIAMAGERLKAPGFTELSSVCVHPDFQAKGLGRRLSLYVGGQISARGTVPFLHSYAVNTKAIGLYESIGFRVRKELKVMVVRKG